MTESAQLDAAKLAQAKQRTESAQAKKAGDATADVGPKAPMAGLIVQRKLRVGHAADPAEVEADQVAESVVARLRAAATGHGDDAGTPDAHHDADPAALDLATDRSPIERIVSRQRRAAGGLAGGDVDADTEQTIGAINGTGQALSSPVRRAMEQAMGTDLSAVRVHSGGTARDLNDRLGAEAFTVGNNIVFRSSVPDLSSPAGAHLLAHELTHVVQQGAAPVRRQPATIRRKRSALTTKEVISIVKGIPQFAGKLDSLVRDETVGKRIEQTLRAYKAHRAKKNDEDIDIRDAMMLSTALGDIARIFADEVLNDPSAATALMPKMLEVFEEEIGNKLKNEKRSLRNSKTSHAKVMSLTKALSGGDPVTQYMHREIRKEVAAKQIIDMAGADKALTPLKVLQLMTERWEAAMSTYTKAQQKDTVEDAGSHFNRAESHGEYSDYFFIRTFGSATPTWEKDKAEGGEKLKVTDDAQAQLDALKKEVQNPSPQVAVKPRDGVTEKQEKHLGALEKNEKEAPSIDTDFQALLAERYLLSGKAAGVLLTDIQKFLRTDMKLSITVDMAKWFGSDTAPKKPDPNFKPAAGARDSTPLAEVFTKGGAKGTIEHLPTWDDTGLGVSARGKHYLRFRHWKDQLMTGLQDLSAGEMASFGSANVTWETAKGSDTSTNHGENYYGNTHFVVDRAKIKDRVIFTATDHGEPRRDPYLALWDICTAGKGRTWLKEIKDFAILDNVVNAVRAKVPLYGVGLKLEFQVFGGLNILTDVTDVCLSPKLSANALARVKDFYKGTAVVVTKLDADAPPGALDGGDGSQMGDGVPEFTRALLAHGDKLDDKDKVSAAKLRTGAGTPFAKSLLVGSYTLAKALVKVAGELTGKMDADDVKALQQMLAKAESMLGATKTMGKDLDTANVKECTEAVAAAKIAVEVAVKSLAPVTTAPKQGDKVAI